MIAIFDWEMSTIGDPLADVGYLTVTWAQADDPPMTPPSARLSAATRREGFMTRDELIARYEEQRSAARWRRSTGTRRWRSGRPPSSWRATSSASRLGSTDDAYLAAFDEGVPMLAEKARAIALS